MFTVVLGYQEAVDEGSGVAKLEAKAANREEESQV